jgi:glutamate synthase (NADPH/NADH) large chain
MGGYSLAHAMMMLIPEAWAGNPLMDDEPRPSTNTMPR